ncbi:hypothetical protein PYW07_002106 [Mythimna separata]|uniref:Nose resistant-to-fluoxetine protein N-terminal domain-containing protein n=1 Tax=Mythimna separata TaxID=271217 RepID=A0AAD8DTV0_MYTSE|nr:hypothetical protein PYW07_002106 [Mythimna separata]
MRFIRRNATLLLQFTDSGIRTPRGVLTGNSVDLGNYHQCLAINHELQDMHIEGKYCSILVPVNQTFHRPRPQDMQGTQFDPSSLNLDAESINKMVEYNQLRSELLALSGNFQGFKHDDRSLFPNNPLAGMTFRLGVCVPKPCTTQQAITSFFFNITAVGFQYREDYCRLTGDKPWSPADYTAVAIFAVLGFITLVSTSYDLCYRFVFKKDVKQMSTICRSFSVYTNGQRLTTFSSGGGNLKCLDGIRTLAMVWVIVGHSFSTEPFQANPADSFEWMLSARALWITAATMTVDTFFTIAGVLLVYTTAGKMNQITFLKNIHWFYLNRFIRVTPLLAATVLLQASYLNQITDGPHWVSVIGHVETCRKNWWSTLLHIQNLVNVSEMCISHSWYVAIDFQLYVLSPIVLVWVLTGKKYLAWMGVVGGLAAVLIASTIYSFNLNLQAGTLVLSRFEDMWDYMHKYYFNTLARASPFFVGLLFGYVLHLYRKTRLQMPWILAVFFWACAAGILGGIFYFKYRIKQFDWDNQLMDNLMNSFMRPAYACAICWLVIACQHGYSGPINWFLSLDAWQLPARLSYGMFLFHYPLMFSLNASMVTPIYFSVGNYTFKFLSYLVLAVVYSFILTLLIDSPISVLFKQLMDSAKKSAPAGKGKGDIIKEDSIKNNEKDNFDHKGKKDVDDTDEKIKSNGEIKQNDFNANSSDALEKSDFEKVTDHNDDDKIVVITDSGVNISSKSKPEIK